MSWNRRQFLIAGGAFGGIGLSVGLSILARANSAQTKSNPAHSTSANPAPANSTPANPTPANPTHSQSTQTPTATGDRPSSSSPNANIINPPKGDIRIAVISDLNSQYGSTDYEPEVDRAIALLPTWQPDLVLCGGDMVAGQKTSLSRSQLQAMWAAFDQHVSAPLRQAGLPFGFTIGNHDGSGARAIDGGLLFATDRAIATEYWNHPQHDPGLDFLDRSGFPFNYTFQHKELFFLVWDASTASMTRAQLEWVERSLASDVAQNSKLRIVIGHLPLYGISVGRDEPGEYLNNAEQLRSLLEKYSVHTYISGHDHAYYPGHRGELQLLHCGLLGSGARSLLNSNLAPQKTLTLIDVKLGAEIIPTLTTYTTYDMKTLAIVDQQKLPKLIATRTEKVLRRDINWEDLTPAEQATEYVPSN